MMTMYCRSVVLLFLFRHGSVLFVFEENKMQEIVSKETFSLLH